MATGGAGTGTTASDAEIAAAMNEFLDHVYKEDREQDEYGYEHIPENKELTDKLFKLLTPETVNKTFVIYREGIGPRRWTPILMAAVHDPKFAKKLITELGADILLENASTSGAYVQTPLKSLVEEYHNMIEYEHYPGNRDDVIAAIAAGVAKYQNSPQINEALNAAFEESHFTPEEIEGFRRKFIPVLEPALRAAIREAAWERRKQMATVLLPRGGARRRRQTRRHRSRRHRTKSRKHSRK